MRWYLTVAPQARLHDKVTDEGQARWNLKEQGTNVMVLIRKTEVRLTIKIKVGKDPHFGVGFPYQ